MNDPLALIAFFFVVVLVWAAMLTLIVLFFMGAAHGDNASAHRDGRERAPSR